MRQLHLNLHGGVAGDMLVAALADAGDAADLLRRTLEGLALPPGSFAWELRRESRGGLSGLRFEVKCREEHAHRHLSEVLTILRASRLPAPALATAEAAFGALAMAEGEAHGCAPEEVHFHEVGAVDAIVDVAAASVLLHALDAGAVWSTAVPVGSGTVRAAHGDLPVPAPGTLRLLLGIPVCGTLLTGERATPTGVALLKAFGARFSERPAGVPLRVGHGLGARDFSDRANLLRVEIEEVAVGQEWLIELRAMVDDQSGETVGAALDALRAAGAVDAYAAAALAKKGRPAFEVVALVEVERQDAMRDLFLRALGSLGLRMSTVRRSRLPRDVRSLTTALGELPHKVRSEADGERAKPEADALRAEAERRGLTLREARDGLGPSGPSPSRP